jgi:hypothetical protein
MSVTATTYAKARAEIIDLFGWDADSLAPAQVLRLDLATALRLALDDLHACLINGERVDMNRMLVASEALSRLLPPAVLAAPPAERREDPRAALLALVLQMRDREGNGERVERSQEPIDPPTSDVVPPGEIADRDPGMRPGPDDPKPPVTIEGKVVPTDGGPCANLRKVSEPPAADDMVDIRGGYNDTPEPWRQFATDVDGVPLSVRGRKYWGPVGG